jgi:alpha-glucosidase
MLYLLMNFSRRALQAACLATLGIFLSCTSSTRSTTPPPSFTPVPIAASAQLAEGAAIFLPAGLSPDRLPPSLCLLSSPQLKAPLPPTWALTPAFSKNDAHTRATLPIPPGASLYGTGEVTGPLLRNHTFINLWNTDSFAYKTTATQLYQSHPWVLGVRSDGTAFGFLADSTWRATLTLEHTIEFTSDGPPFPLILIDRPSPKLVLQTLASLIGTTPLPPRWALGYQQSRWSYLSQQRVQQIADEFRNRHIPCDAIWMDIDYMDGYRSFTFNPKTFPDPKALNDFLHRHNFHSVWMIDPGVKAEPGYRVYDSGTACNAWVKTAAGAVYHGAVWPGDCVFPDFTAPDVRAWWASLYTDFLATGIDGVWNDMNEPAVQNSPTKTMPIDNHHRGGGGGGWMGGEELPPGPHLQYHNVYGMLQVRATREALQALRPDTRPFVLTRANFLGGQRFAATWTGDNVSSVEHMKMSIPMVLNLGLSGQAFSGPDLGGFAENATPELWAQWVAVGAFYPFARAHAATGTNDKEPWAFGPETESAARLALNRRYRLLPYLYTQFYHASQTGIPIMQPVFFADPQDLALRAEQQAFLFGPDLLVIPKWAVAPHLPKGAWRSVSFMGENAATDPYQADVRIRPGAIVPLGKPVESTMQESLDPLTLLISFDSAGQAQGTLYEDADDGYGYQKGDYLLTTYHAQRSPTGIDLTIAKSEGHRASPKRQIQLQLVTDQGPQPPTLVDDPSQKAQ